MRLRNRVLAGAACVALVAVLAACGTTTDTTTSITGTTLTVYSSLPLQGPESSEATDVLDAERLALQQAGSKVGRYTITFKSLNDATSTGWSPKLIADNARTVIQNNNSVAYIGEIDPNASAQSIPITNADQVLQVSPYDTAIGLTEATAAVAGSPDTYYQSLSAYGRTFGRVVPNDTYQAKAQLQVMKGLGVKNLSVADDGTPYGDAIALAVEQDAHAYGITALPVLRAGAGLAKKVSNSVANALFYGGVASTGADQEFNAAVAADPPLKLFGPGGLYTGAFAAGLSAAAQRVTYLSEPGLSTAELPVAGRDFVSDFKAAYHHTPWTQAIFGYAAMQLVLGSLHRAANANDRAEDVAGMLATKKSSWSTSAALGTYPFSSVLGPYAIDKNGDTSLAPYIFSRVKGGKLVVFKGLIVP
jgi:branched-chain amino acid transport system substrate-binding protein